MNLVTKNVTTSLKFTLLALVAPALIISCGEGGGDRKSLAVYQGAPKSVSAKNTGIQVKDSTAEFEVTSDLINNVFDEKEIEQLEQNLSADQSLSAPVVSFDFTMTDEKLVNAEKPEDITLAFYSKDKDGKLTRQLTDWMPLNDFVSTTAGSNKSNSSFSFKFIATNKAIVKMIREELSKMTRERNEDNDDEADASEFMNFHMALSIDSETITSSINFKNLCVENPGNFLSNSTDTKSDGCDSL